MEIKREYYLDKLIKRQNNGLIKVIIDIMWIVDLYMKMCQDIDWLH